MITGVRGRLISATFAQTELRSLPGASLPPPELIAALEGWAQRWASGKGPPANLRAMADAIVIPLLVSFIVRLVPRPAPRRTRSDGANIIDGDYRRL